MFEEDARRSSGRRSRLEIACEILEVVSRGTERPTRIMQLANVTWDDLIMYLEALMRNELVSRQVEGKRVTYSLTQRGSALLGHYVSLKREAAPLGLENMSKETISKALTRLPSVGAQEADLYTALEGRVKNDGSKILSPKIVGKSGAVHSLGLVAQRTDGSKHGYVVVKAVDETQIMKLFVTQLDTDLVIHAFYLGELSPKAGALAKAYSLDVRAWADEEAAPPQGRGRVPSKVDPLKFAGRQLLLEVDPSVNYESAVRDFAVAYSSSGYFVFAFTWKGGPIYSALSSVEDVQILGMVSGAAYPRQVGRGKEMAVPQDDAAVLLDLTEKTLQGHAGQKTLMVFDSASDLVISLGFERAYAFLKSQKEILAREPNSTALVIVKGKAHDEKILSLIRGIYADHLAYDPKGLAVTRQT